MDQNDYNQISLLNIDSEPFQCIYNNQSYGVIMPGQVRTFPQLMANIFLKHMIDAVLNHREQSTADLVKREELTSQIVVNVQLAVQEAPKSQDQLLQEKVAQMNKPSDLELHLAKQNTQPQGEEPPVPQPIAPPIPAMPVAPASDELGSVLSGVQAEQKELSPTPPPAPAPTPQPQPVPPVPQPTEQPPQPVPTAQPQQTEISVPLNGQPSRDDLIQYAKNTLMINTEDPKTQQAWASLSDADLARELNYEAQ